MGLFTEDIILDEEAFNKASNDFDALAGKLEKLRTDIQDMLTELHKGFDTPAGTKLINSCEKHLFKPLDDQKIVLEHISSTLLESKRQYDSVFQKYEELQTAINQAKEI